MQIHKTPVLAAVVCAALFSGCTWNTTNNALSVISDAANLKYYYDDGQVVDFVDDAELNDVELVQVIEALDQVERSRVRLKQYADDPVALVRDIDKVAFEYAKIRSAYLSVRGIVVRHWDEYADEKKIILAKFDGSATAFDLNFASLVEAAEANAALMTALNLANTALKVAAVM